MSRDDANVLDLLKAAREAVSFVEGMTEEQFRGDRRTQAAVLYELTIIGEAVKRLSEPFRAAQGAIPWRQMAGTRDRVVHDYGRVDLARVWSVLRDELPRLIPALEAIAKKPQ